MRGFSLTRLLPEREGALTIRSQQREASLREDHRRMYE